MLIKEKIVFKNIVSASVISSRKLYPIVLQLDWFISEWGDYYVVLCQNGITPIFRNVRFSRLVTPATACVTNGYKCTCVPDQPRDSNSKRLWS